ncbi:MULTISPECIES: substrate-binding periplasmic protein [Paraburkholderia]|uniref:substrate-binding periplasmic protein n=1 Tax=Paraburkholderia TaxID=1822464 RepID=UPI00165647EF|nr:transporter substrate-binding domain-containing protein [Paraburkholderia podalyriae]
MNSGRHYALVLLLGASTYPAIAQNCVPAHKFNTIVPGTLTIAMGELPPFDTLDKDGNYTGVEADLLKIIAKKECLKIAATQVDPAGQVQYVFSRKADIGAFGWYRSAARAKILNVSDPLLVERLAIYSKDGATSIDSLRGWTTGTIQGYLWVPDLKKILGDSLRLYPNPVALAQDLSAGRIDAAIDSYTKGIYAQKHSGGYSGWIIKVAQPNVEVKASVQPAQTTLLMSKDATDLASAINSDLRELRANGTIRGILKTYGLDPSAAEVGEPRLLH